MSNMELLYVGELVLVWNDKRVPCSKPSSPEDEVVCRPYTDDKFEGKSVHGGWTPAVISRSSTGKTEPGTPLTDRNPESIKVRYFEKGSRSHKHSTIRVKKEQEYPKPILLIEGSYETVRNSISIEADGNFWAAQGCNIMRLIDPRSIIGELPQNVFDSMKTEYSWMPKGKTNMYKVDASRFYAQGGQSDEFYIFFDEGKEIENFEKVTENLLDRRRGTPGSSGTSIPRVSLEAFATDPLVKRGGLAILVLGAIIFGISKLLSSSGTQAPVQTGGGSRTKRRRSRTRRSRTRRSRTRRSRRSRTRRSRRKRTKRTKRKKRK